MKNKILFITFILQLVIIGTAIYYLIRKSPKNSIAPRIIIPREDPALKVTPLPGIGVVVDKVKLTGKDEQLSELINKTPLDNKSFSISMDYKNYLFIVTIKSPSADNYPIFQQWIIDNNFEKIPKEKLKIISL